MAILFSIFLISFSILSYEILLMRVFSITSWSHFAYMIISIALLGFGASGTFISLLQARLKKHFYSFFTLFSLLFSLSLWLCFVLSQKIPFNPFLIVWYKRQYLYLMEYYLLLFIPFFLGASCIGLSFSQLGQKINKIYFSNLLGSGSGALGVIFLMYLLSPTSILLLITAVAFLSTLISSLCLIGKIGIHPIFFRKSRKAIFYIFSQKMGCIPILILFTLASLLFFSIFSPKLNISQYKSLRVALNLPQAKVLKEVSSPLGLIDVVESQAIRYTPGLSLNFNGEIPPQLGIF
ncbi:SAM-dependent methyltransferase, partial [Candidatus Aerophobetes bacterium]